MGKKIKILGLAGSERRRGNSYALVKYALKGAENEGAEIELLDINSLKIESCLGCLSCVFKGKCTRDDDISAFLDKLLASEGLVVSAPTYLLSPAAVIKRLLDRFLMLSTVLDKIDTDQRAAVTFSVSGNERWNPLGAEMVNQFALACGYRIIDYKEAYAPGPAEVVLQEKIMQDAFTMGQNLTKTLKGKPVKKRVADPKQCPVCFSKVFRLQDGNKVQCPICLIEGRIEGEKGVEKVIFTEEKIKDNFWAPAHRRRHLEEWIKKTREPYLAKRKEIKEKLIKYEL